jgi:ribonucleotide reductase beta subunit family protein with ferritin-like domain
MKIIKQIWEKVGAEEKKRIKKYIIEMLKKGVEEEDKIIAMGIMLGK